MSELADRARVRALRRELDLRQTLEQLRRDGWSPKRAAIALELGETFVLRVLLGPTSQRPRADPMVRALAAELDDRPRFASALHDLVVESRGGLWAVEWRPLPLPVVSLLCRRRLTRQRGPTWEPTKLGCDVDYLRQRCRIVRDVVESEP